MDKAFEDEKLKALVGLYSPASVPESSYWRDLEAKAKSFVPIRRLPKPAWVLFSPGILAVAALWVFVFWPRNLDLPWELTSGRVLAQAEQNGKLKAAEADVILRTSGETLVLRTGAELEILSRGDGASFTPKGNRYFLHTGTLELDHFNPDTTFRLETPFGAIAPLGTKLIILVTSEYQVLSCTEGKLEFTPAEGQGTVLAAGETLRWPPESVNSPSGNPGESLPSPDPSLPSEKSTDPSPVVSPVTKPPENREPGFSIVTLWSRDFSEPVVSWSEVSGQVLGTTADRVQVWSLATGQPGPQWNPGADPWVSDGENLYLYRGGTLSRIDARGTQVWSAATAPLAFGGLGYAPGGIYLPSADGTLSRWDPATGAKVTEISLETGSYGIPLVLGPEVYLSTLDRRLRAWEFATGRVLWTLTAQERFVGDRPVVWGDRLVTKTRDGQMLVINRSTGDLLWSIPTGQTQGSYLWEAGDRALVPTTGGIRFYTPGGAEIPWNGGVVLSGGILEDPTGRKVLVTAESDGLWENSRGERERLTDVSLRSAVNIGNSLVCQTVDGRIQRYTLTGEIR